MKKKSTFLTAQAQAQLAKAKGKKRAPTGSSNLLLAGLVGVLLAEEGYAAASNPSNDAKPNPAKKSVKGKSAETKNTDSTLVQDAKEGETQTANADTQSIPASEPRSTTEPEPLARFLRTPTGHTLPPSAERSVAADKPAIAKEASPSPGVQEPHAGKEIIFPTPAAGAAPVANLLQDEITWLTQSLARTSKGLGGIFFSEAPNTTALSQALRAETQFWNETIAFAAGQIKAIDFPQMGGQSSFAQLLGDETNLVMQASAKLAQEQGLIQFPGANPMGASNLASLFGQEARQIDLANAANKPAGSIDFAQNLSNARQDMASLFAGESIEIARAPSKGDVPGSQVTVQVADLPAQTVYGEAPSGISMQDIGLGLLGLALAAAAGGGGGGGGGGGASLLLLVVAHRLPHSPVLLLMATFTTPRSTALTLVAIAPAISSTPIPMVNTRDLRVVRPPTRLWSMSPPVRWICRPT